jgi:photosystem II stability/assembly factor-like uncharacterized protein
MLLRVLLTSSAVIAASWIPQVTHVEASLRGLDAVDANVVWASGTQGTWLKTLDGGRHWQSGKVKGAESLDFRDVQAWSGNEANLLSIGTGSDSRVYKTSDGGDHWDLLFTNPDSKGFFDAFAFWDRNRGVLLGDPVDGHFVIFTTLDGGHQWTRRLTPPALDQEGAFAASGTCLAVSGSHDIWFVTGGASHARVFHSPDEGATWSVKELPLAAGTPSAGAFSIAFADTKHGAVVGGDYRKPNETNDTLALTSDGGETWRSVPGLRGFRSAIVFAGHQRRTLFAAGTSGVDESTDGGITWSRLNNYSVNGLSIDSKSSGWSAGANGRILKFLIQ